VANPITGKLGFHMGGADVRREYARATARMVGTSDESRGVGRRGGSVCEEERMTEERALASFWEWERRGRDFSRASVRPCSACTKVRT